MREQNRLARARQAYGATSRQPEADPLFKANVKGRVPPGACSGGIVRAQRREESLQAMRRCHLSATNAEDVADYGQNQIAEQFSSIADMSLVTSRHRYSQPLLQPVWLRRQLWKIFAIITASFAKLGNTPLPYKEHLTLAALFT